MIDALYNGISGLNGYQTALNSESNNLANINTVAYKSDNISFADQMYQSQMGKGMKVDTIDKSFAQGNLKITTGTYDMAIKGKGFFIVKGNTEELLYTRAGNFRMAEDGTLQLPNGFKVQGIPASSATVIATGPDTMFTNEYSNFIASQTIKSENDSVVETINSKTTNYASSATDDLDTQKGSGYKTKEAKIADIEALTTAYRNELSLYSTLPIEGEAATNQVTNVGFTMGQLSSGIDSVEITVGTTTHKQKFRNDTLTTLQDLADSISSSKMMSASVDANGILQITSMLPGQSVSISNAQILNGAVVATPVPVVTTTEAVVGSGKAKLESIEAALKTAIEDAGGKYLKLSNTIDSSNLENTTMTELQMKLDTLNISDTPFGTAEIENGVMYVKQGDNRFAVGKVTTAVFSNELGLDPQGDNLYASTTKSGDIIFATNENEILGQTLELSNSELSESLVDLMVYQRSFEASSKAVTTSDEFLKTAIQLKK
jgi:flagellar hook protein FlgE